MPLHLHVTIPTSTPTPSTATLTRRSVATGWLSATLVATAATAMAQAEQPPDSDTLSNIPQMLSGECPPTSPNDCKRPRIQRPKSKKAESCTGKCVSICTRGDDGGPSEATLNIRGPLVVFKQGFRSRQYCLVECSDICNLLGDQDYGP